MYLPIQEESHQPHTTFVPAGGKPLDLAPLTGTHQADIAIVGGGIAGCSAALHAAERGTRVALLEANQIGWGASGRNSGRIVPGTRHHPQQIIARYGAISGHRLIDAAARAPLAVGELVARHSIDCDYSVPGIIMAAHTDAAMRANAKYVGYWRTRGRPVELLDRRQAASMIGSDRYLGAYIDRRGAKINPLAYVRGLAHAAIKARASLYEGTHVIKVSRERGKWRVTTAKGSVRADMVFLCTNAYTDDLWPGLRQTIMPLRLYQFVSRPLRDDLRKCILPGGQAMTDSRRLPFGIRLHPDGRLQLDAYGSALGPMVAPAQRAALARLGEVFPQLWDMEVDHWWSCLAAANLDRSWHIHELERGLLAMIGCDGRGVALATIYGRELARYAHGTSASDLVLPSTSLKRIMLYPVARRLVPTLIRYCALRDSIEMRRLKHTRPVNANNA